MIRCKFYCEKVSKRVGWNGQPFVYEAEFAVVMGDSEENKKFFAATPCGRLTIGTLSIDTFEPGQHYYLDLTPVPAEA